MQLFETSTDFAACPDIFPPDKFNAGNTLISSLAFSYSHLSGVLVIKPSLEILQNMKNQVDILPSYDGGDTGNRKQVLALRFELISISIGFLNSFFPDWFQSSGRLPFGYNAQRTLHWMTFEKNPGYWNAINPLKVIHYSSSPKPWEKSKDKYKTGNIYYEPNH